MRKTNKKNNKDQHWSLFCQHEIWTDESMFNQCSQVNILLTTLIDNNNVLFDNIFIKLINEIKSVTMNLCKIDVCVQISVDESVL